MIGADTTPCKVGLISSFFSSHWGVLVEEITDCDYSHGGWKTLYFSLKESTLLEVKMQRSFFLKSQDDTILELSTIAYHLSKLLDTPLEEVPLIVFDENYEIFKNVIRCKLDGIPLHKTPYPSDKILLE